MDATGFALGAVEAAAAALPASKVAFSATTIAGSLGSAAIKYAAADSARTIGGVISVEQKNTGVSAYAVTRARLGFLSATGTVAFDLAAEGEVGHVNVTVAHSQETEVLLLDLLTSHGEFSRRS